MKAENTSHHLPSTDLPPALHPSHRDPLWGQHGASDPQHGASDPSGTGRDDSAAPSFDGLRTPFPRFTVEIALWGLLLLTSLGLRLLRLDAAPLNAAEARDALSASRFAQGGSAPAATGYSPALFSGQWLTFFFLGASDLSARLLPALAGAALTLSPALLRRQLGRLAALSAGVLLTLSPTALTLSRTASGDILTALGALLFTAGLWRWIDNVPQPDETPFVHRPAQRSIVLPSLGLALVLASSPLAYSALLALVAALLLILVEPQTRARLQTRWDAFRAAPENTRYALGALVGGLLLLSTAFAWNIEGLAAAAHLPTAWTRGFVRWPDSLSAGYPVLILFVYEPLILLAGGAGVVLATVRRPNATARFMASWSVAALALALIRPGHGPGDVLLILVPLACLGGLACEALVTARHSRGHPSTGLAKHPRGTGYYSNQPAWLNPGIFVVISMPLWIHLALNLANYVHRPWQHTALSLPLVNLSLPTYLSLAMLSLVLLLFLAVMASAAQGPGPTLHGLALSTVLALLCFTVTVAWGVSQNRPAAPRAPLVIAPTAPAVRLLRDSLVGLSNEQKRGARGIDLTVLSDDPALAWVLRDFSQLRFADTARGALSTSAIITRQTLGRPELGQEGYVGQGFALRQRWEPTGLNCRRNLAQDGPDQVEQLDCKALVEWLLYRRSPTEPAQERIVLWVRQDLVRAK